MPFHRSTKFQVALTELADIPQGTALGRNKTAGTGPPVALTAFEQMQNLRIADITDTLTTGAQTSFTVAANTYVRLNMGSTLLDIQGITAPSPANSLIFIQVDRLKAGGVGSIVFRHEHASATGLRLSCPGNVDLWPEPGDVIVGIDHNSRWVLFCVSGITAGKLRPIENTRGVPFNIFVPCPSGGSSGTADDVTIINATLYPLRILEAALRVSTAVALSTATLRTASGGGGSAVLLDASTGTMTFATATTGPRSDTATATATVAAGGSLFLRRSDRSVVGELVLTCVRT